MATTVVSAHIAQRYQLLNQFGEGGMGKVYRTLDRLSGQIVALKQVTVDAHALHFSSQREDHQDIRLALTHEFKTLASLRHPNIVSVMDYGFDSRNQPFFTMTFLEGAQTIIEAGCDQPTELQYSLLLQLLQALFYLHRRGILHRDLKPGNVLVVNGQVKVLDFGLSTTVSETGGTSGTLAYLSPEVLQGQPVSEASDLYSLGVMAYELFAGKHPFRLDSQALLINDILSATPDFSSLRQPEPIVGFISRLLNKVPAARPPDAARALAELSAATGQHLSTETVLTRESFLQAAQFVGREAELAQLSEAVRRALSGQGGLWLVGGESGIGKSRLLDEMRIVALVNGAFVLSGQSISEGRAPYQLWRPILRQLCLQTEMSDLEKSVLQAVVPDIGVLVGSVIPDPPDLGPQAAHERLVQTICAIFSRQKQPIVVILEDLQWAGSESITVLRRLGRQVSRESLLLVGGFRNDESPDLPSEIPGANLLNLHRLTKERIGELTVSILGKSLGSNATLVDYLSQQTEGNVFFLVEVLRFLAEQAGQLTRIGTLPLPEQVFSGGIGTVVRRRLGRVPEWAQPLLQVAAIVGRQLDQTLLTGVQPQIDLELWLRTCAEASVLESHDNGWRFSHDKLREGVLADLLPELRQELHERVALAIEQCYPDDTHAAALLGHWAAVKNTRKEAHYAALAGEQALRAGANRQAIIYLERAESLAEQVGTALARHVEIRFLLSSAHNALGMITDTQRQLERTLSLGGVALPSDQKQLLLQILAYLLGQAWYRIKFDLFKRPQQAHRHAELLGVSSRAAELMAQIAVLLNVSIAAFYYALVQLQLAEQAGPDYRPLQARAYATMMVGMGSVRFHSAARHYQRLMVAARRFSNDPYMRFWTQMAPGYYLAARGAWAEAQAHLKMSSRLADEMGDTRHWTESQSFLGCVFMYMGNWPAAEQLWQEMYTRNIATGDATFLALATVALAGLALWKGDQHPGEERLRRNFESFTHTLSGNTATVGLLTMVLGMLTQGQIRQGRLDVAESYLVQFLALPRLDSTANFANAVFHSIAAEATLHLLEAEASEPHRLGVDKALDYIRRCGRFFECAKPYALLYDGWLAWLEGKPNRAVKLGERAILCAQRLQMPYVEGLAHYHLGRHLSADDSRRLEHLRQAELLFARLGSVYDLEQTRQALM